MFEWGEDSDGEQEMRITARLIYNGMGPSTSYHHDGTEITRFGAVRIDMNFVCLSREPQVIPKP